MTFIDPQIDCMDMDSLNEYIKLLSVSKCKKDLILLDELIDIRKQYINYQLTHYKIQFFDNAIILSQ